MGPGLRRDDGGGDGSEVDRSRFPASVTGRETPALTQPPLAGVSRRREDAVPRLEDLPERKEYDSVGCAGERTAEAVRVTAPEHPTAPGRVGGRGVERPAGAADPFGDCVDVAGDD